MNIAFIGLGTMGAPMAQRLVEAGHEVTVFNRTASRMQPLAEAGAKTASSPREAARGAEVAITIVSDTPDVEDVILGADGLIHGLQAGATVIDMSTVSPDATVRIAGELKTRGVNFLDAPCSGGSEGAQHGTLSIMVGGEAATLDAVRPLLDVLGSKVTRIGGVGAGQICKAVNQVVIAGTYAAVAEGLSLALAAGVDTDAVRDAIGSGAAGSWCITHRGANMTQGTYPLGFKTRLHRKDLLIALETARSRGVPLPLAAAVEQQETELIRRGFGDEDVSNLARLAREAAGLDA
jgi:3-hydroxyisobutyrate dehydrogenase